MKRKNVIEETATTPRFELDKDKGVITIKGRSIPTDPNIFFGQIESLVDQYLSGPAESTTVNIMVDYFNTPSDKWLLHIFRKFEGVYNFGKEIKITWYYEEGDDDIQKAGEYYKSILKVPFYVRESEESLF